MHNRRRGQTNLLFNNYALFCKSIKKNQWKNTLNVKQINILEKKFRDFMDKFGYD